MSIERPMKRVRLAAIIAAWCIATLSARAQAYGIKNGRMYVQLPKHISAASLDSFIQKFDLAELGLSSLIRFSKADSAGKAGWRIEQNNTSGIVLSKAFEAFRPADKLSDNLLLKHLPEGEENERNPLFPAVNNGIVVGTNNFRNKTSFYRGDSLVRFFLRGYKNAGKVRLAGSFNDWKPDQLSMLKTDSGWIYDLKLGAGKYWYKFIADGNWLVDFDNTVAENDGRGNINSVFFRPNTFFFSKGFPNAKKVYLAGSFTNWKPAELRMRQTPNGWELPLYLAQGTHTYKFVVDGNWYADPTNGEKLPDGQGSYNSIVRIGHPYLFQLKGFSNAKEVTVAGTFNHWRDFELPMKKTASGWEFFYTLGPGNHEYKFRVDGKWISDPANPLSSSATGNSFLVIQPNYTFRLKAFASARSVYLAGDFNGWDPKAYPMKKTGTDWTFPVHLSAGKHRYKFVVDGKWIIDPSNKLWEQNEYGTGNSIVWIED